MRPQEEVLDSVFLVLGKETIEQLDDASQNVLNAFTTLFVKEASIVDKHVAFTQLVTNFEAYLKKFFYLIEGKEVSPQHEGDPVTLNDVIHAICPLWTLRYNDKPVYQTLYQYLLMVKEWRNNEAQLSPTASEQEVHAAIEIVITMYFFATGSCITELESNGQGVESHGTTFRSSLVPLKPYTFDAENSAENGDNKSDGLGMVAERMPKQYSDKCGHKSGES